ncbi:acyl-CoA-binding domain-containing protein 5A-like isoform X1 [Pseudochaenichthys georgianus]|uniref:acyl-CoA-binding domain-containing protein 5A-like isoform X1 n=3 Tax=Pseudochaenichthys georgianus TaxID=52239 RepID=UPI00146DCF5C|nr:acyl-CoA-binding domain-containing protein 5A-like isoform X1 [Pseudochaenichthys georgianus]
MMTCEDSLISSVLGLSMAEEDRHSLEAKFVAAVKVIRSLPEDGPFQPSDDMLLMFCSYYKQATLGPCEIPRPNGFWDSHGKEKWDAWSSLGNMTKEEAMKNYIEDIQMILETIPISDEVSDLVQKLGNFYTDGEREEGEAEDHEVDSKPFTRPFANHADELNRQLKKPAMEGYGDLWDDIQNVHENVSSEEAWGSKENSEVERNEESSDWRKSEEEDNGDEEDNTEDEDEEGQEEKGWRPDPTLLMVNKRWRSDARGSSSSMEPSVCSFTNGTHSSLNSEVEEEELACSIEPSIEQYNSYMHFNGHPSGHSEVVPEKNRRSTDSDEEFCDSMEHLAMEEGLSTSRIRSPGSAAVSVRQRDHWFESNTTLNAGEDQVLMGDSYFKEGISVSNNSSLSRRGRVPGSPLPGTPCDSQRSASVDAVCCCVSHSRYPVSVARENINEQIATALLRLQHDMSRVLHRLHALEALTVSQSRSSSPKQEDALAVAQKFLRPAWWPFDFSPLTVVFTTLWPVVAHWLVQVYLQRRRRKIA